jgi:hypothetical protein
VKKIGLLTIHATTNYGGVLQAFATQAVLEQYGDVKIIDYRNSFVDKTMQLVRFGTKPRDILRVAKDLFRLYPRYRVIKKFQTFIDENMKLTKFANNRLNDISKEFDYFITGSDQIWNPKTVSENFQLDDVYLLGFVEDKQKIAYASSIGDYEVKKDDRLLSLLTDFDAISLREKNSSEEISGFLNREIKHVLDPTLLLNKEQWISVLGLDKIKLQKNRYIFLYALKKDALFKNTVKKVASELGLDTVIVDQDPFLDFPVTKQYKDASPAEFLSLFLHADFVITNSFHGAAFSVNFEKEFYSVLPPSSPNRVTGLLSELGLSERLISKQEEIENLTVSNVDFTDARVKLGRMRENSLSYLDTHLKTDIGEL